MFISGLFGEGEMHMAKGKEKRCFTSTMSKEINCACVQSRFSPSQPSRDCGVVAPPSWEEPGRKKANPSQFSGEGALAPRCYVCIYSQIYMYLWGFICFYLVMCVCDKSENMILVSFFSTGVFPNEKQTRATLQG